MEKIKKGRGKIKKSEEEKRKWKQEKMEKENWRKTAKWERKNGEKRKD